MAQVSSGDPDVVLNASAKAERRACISCPQYDKCLFHLKRMGGFKANERFATRGRHNVGYQLLTDRTERNAAKVDQCSCEVFVETLQDRMLNGRNLREAGKDGEVIRICAQEGETIKRTFQVGFNVHGEVVRPQLMLVPALKAADYKVNLSDMAVAEFRKVALEMEIPVFVLPSTAHDPTAQEIMDDLRRSEALEADMEERVFEESRRRADADVVKPKAVKPASAKPADENPNPLATKVE